MPAFTRREMLEAAAVTGAVALAGANVAAAEDRPRTDLPALPKFHLAFTMHKNVKVKGYGQTYIGTETVSSPSKLPSSLSAFWEGDQLKFTEPFHGVKVRVPKIKMGTTDVLSDVYLAIDKHLGVTVTAAYGGKLAKTSKAEDMCCIEFFGVVVCIPNACLEFDGWLLCCDDAS
jgi:hypothetical protein